MKAVLVLLREAQHAIESRVSASLVTQPQPTILSNGGRLNTITICNFTMQYVLVRSWQLQASLTLELVPSQCSSGLLLSRHTLLAASVPAP